MSPSHTACKRFTPVLKSLYENLKIREGVEEFELIYCSMDRCQSDYSHYTKNMPWWCLPFQSPAIARLASCYQAVGVPHLVVIDRDGTVLLEDGVQEVTVDPHGHCFPWRPRPVVDLLPAEFMRPDGQMVPMSTLDNKYLMLYFGASWCGPCREFLGKLVKAYHGLRAVRDDFEVSFSPVRLGKFSK